MLYRVLAIVAILVLLAGTILLGRSGGERDQRTAAENAPGSTGYTARDAQLVETGADGRPLYRLDAARIEQRPGGGDVDLEELTMHYRTVQGTDWQLRAARGRLPPDAHEVELEGAVRLTGPIVASADASTHEFEVATERLHVDMRAERVSTGEPVLLTWWGQRLASRGLAANLKDQQVRLESSVHGRFTRP